MNLPEHTHIMIDAMLAHLHRGGQYTYLWCNPGKQTRWFQVGDPIPTFDADRHNIYFGVHPVTRIPERNARGEKTRPELVRAHIADIAVINCLFSEFDANDFDNDKSTILTHIVTLETVPSAVVDSGGGLHAYWFLNAPYVLDTDEKRKRAVQLQYEWVQHTRGDPGAKDLARVLRLPGTLNLKYTPARPVTFITFAPEKQYTFDELVRRVTQSPKPHPAQPPRQQKNAPLGQLAQAKMWLKQLASWRCDDYQTWVNVGFALSELGAEGLALWDLWSQSSAKYQPGECARKWTSFTPRQGITLASLRYWANHDNIKDMQQTTPHQRFHCTDVGNAQRLVKLHGQNQHYCYAWDKWLIWDGTRWTMDETGKVERQAKHTVRMINVEAAECLDDEQRSVLQKWAKQSEHRARIEATIKLAQSEPGIAIRVHDLDHDPWLFNAQNGTLDLRTGKLRPHRRQDLITELAPVTYIPEAGCPNWKAFLQRIMNDNQNMIAFIQRAIGYSLTGDTSERAMFILHGKGANGKSTLIEVFRTLLGNYALRTPTQTLMTHRSDQIPNDVARLKGARFVSASESEQGQNLAESLIKDLTGGDTISARFMRAEWFEFRPECKIWLATNHKPIVRGGGQAIWDRIRLIPFPVCIPEKEQDKMLRAKLIAELPGILNWALAGCLDWQRQGLGMPIEVKRATAKYQIEMDKVTRFLGDVPLVQRANVKIVFADLYKMFKVWAEDNGELILSKRKFAEQITKLGFIKNTGAHNVLFVFGLGYDI